MPIKGWKVITVREKDFNILKKKAESLGKSLPQLITMVTILIEANQI